MSKIKIIIQPCHGVFQPKPEFEELIKSKGYQYLWGLDARTDNDLIEYVENNYDGEHQIMEGNDYWTYISVVEVDTSRPWFIDNYDGSEYITYVEYEVINKELNFVKMKH